jgi:ribose transport system substrate-binding protein
MEEIMKKFLVIALIIAMALVMVAGCSNQAAQEDEPATPATSESSDSSESASAADEPEETAAPEEYRFTLVSPLVGHPYWVTVEDGMKAANEQFGVDTQYVGPTEINIDEQIKYFETAIASKVDGIITMALDPEAFTPVIDKAVDAGIPVVLIDTDAPDSKRNFYAGTSNFAAGQAAGESLIEATGGKAQIGIITGAINAANLNERIDGFNEAIKEYPDMKVLAVEPSDTDLLKATEKAQTLLQTYPEMNAMFGVSATDVQGAAKVVEEQNKIGEITLVGFDDMDDTIQYIKDGVVYSTIVQKPFEMGRLGVELLVQIKEGNAPSEPVIDTGVTIVTKDNIDSYQ